MDFVDLLNIELDNIRGYFVVLLCIVRADEVSTGIAWVPTFALLPQTSVKHSQRDVPDHNDSGTSPLLLPNPLELSRRRRQ